MAAVALAGLTGCADRPNDLDTYYDDPTTSAPAGVAVSSSQPPPSPAPTPAEVRLAQQLSSAVLINADVAGEGVHPAPPQTGPTGCLATMPKADDPALRRSAHWEYPSGSALGQAVIGYPEESASGQLDKIRCTGGKPMNLPPAPGVDAQAASCVPGAPATCTVLLAKGPLLSAVQVTASTESRAMDAAKRLAPIAAAKLS
ncbi:hypothetical protein [Amycolatopsis nigrescens]|uniref:hypothetical protein n=1 Tax=Amycolatopsis nigrescens TaxID=381445 RepID=UPI00036CBB3F|nr:hypothetical protein [Amycolatopsis nigrescens]